MTVCSGSLQCCSARCSGKPGDMGCTSLHAVALDRDPAQGRQGAGGEGPRQPGRVGVGPHCAVHSPHHPRTRDIDGVGRPVHEAGGDDGQAGGRHPLRGGLHLRLPLCILEELIVGAPLLAAHQQLVHAIGICRPQQHEREPPAQVHPHRLQVL
eukprot:CAMPEP_0206141196 /NCGR_PEP_ID=MMETSP1473-20131121/12074_1 /ASSEMBLY_ACC=CAM_ASM_001109 /TAXON_ID=1461547 /ORGANISM="Stichococcus sp, Strain RCC1054" /LENGTH=153 /DNA_ID=CAMNT_0053535659 /DNA_START=2186 /DNA_END=2644 /DNA_ORIENTATION=+